MKFRVNLDATKSASAKDPTCPKATLLQQQLASVGSGFDYEKPLAQGGINGPGW